MKFNPNSRLPNGRALKSTEGVNPTVPFRSILGVSIISRQTTEVREVRANSTSRRRSSTLATLRLTEAGMTVTSKFLYKSQCLTLDSYSTGKIKNGSYRIREKATVGGLNEMSYGSKYRGVNGSKMSRSNSKKRIKRNKLSNSSSNVNLSKSSNRYADKFFSSKKNREWLRKMGSRKVTSKSKSKLIKLNHSHQ